MTRARYTHHEALTFSGYIDGDTGRTLHAVPGGVYEVFPGPAPLPWFTPLDGEPEPEQPAEPQEPEPAAALEPEPEEQQQPEDPQQ